jgi:restriction system protein
VAIPDYQTVMLPLLRMASAREELAISDAIPLITAHYGLTSAEQAETIRSGKTKIRSRVEWAATYLVHAGAMTRPRRGVIAITPRGRDILASEPSRIDFGLLAQFEEFREFIGVPHKTSASPATPAVVTPSVIATSPDELLDQGYSALRNEVEAGLLARLRAASPEFFEQSVVDLLVAMGFGGSHADAARRIGKTGDEGVDGVIDEDPLGLDALYIQAKRWASDHNVGIHEMQAFVGTLVGKKAGKGVFLTTSSFTAPAVKYLDTVGHRVVLVDGEMVARLMFDHDIGVRTRHSYAVKSIDESYFEGE